MHATVPLLPPPSACSPAAASSPRSQATKQRRVDACAARPPSDRASRRDQPPATGGRALKLMHERHEGMEKIGKTMQDLSRE